MVRTVIGDSVSTEGLNVLGSIQVGGTEVVNSAGEIKADIKDTLAQGSIYVGDATNITSEVDASTNTAIMIGNGTTVASQTIGGDGSITNTGTLTITQAAGGFIVKGGALASTLTSDAATGGIITAGQNSASPAANDVPGAFTVDGQDDDGNATTYARLTGTIVDPTDAAEIGSAAIEVQNGTGALAVAADFSHDGSYGTIETDIIIANGNAGTASGTVEAEEFGTGFHHVTVLTLNAEPLAPPTAAANEAHGTLLYTFPAGVHSHKVTHMSVGLQGGGVVDADTPKIGVGSVIGTGAVAVLNGTPTFMDYLTESTAGDCAGTPTDLATPATAGYGTGISMNQAADVKAVHLNYADGWAGADTLTATGQVVLEWTSIA